MANKIAISTLNASTYDILNVIRANGSAEYQSLVPVASTVDDIRKIGQSFDGYPALANQFLNALVNRIALTLIKSSTFNNPYASLKKGYLALGETVEEVFVGLCKAIEFNPEKAEAREFKRYLPDVKARFHTMNWRVLYPITVQEEDLRLAFISESGVTNLIATIIQSVIESAEYDEYLLFKYLIIKGVTHGKMYPVKFDASNIKNASKAFRGKSNLLEFVKTEFNNAGVHTRTQKKDQHIFMDAQYNADYDVDVLASAFNMDKATFSGNLHLIDDFTTFDNDRFDIIRANCDMIEEVTASELNLMKKVKAVLVDGEWFQVYDNLMRMDDTPVKSGLQWNYFYHNWKTVCTSDFSNAIVFVEDTADITVPDVIKCSILSKDVSSVGTVFTLAPEIDGASLNPGGYRFIQNQNTMEAGVAVQEYGAVMFPPNADPVTLSFEIKGRYFVAASTLATTADVGDEITFNSTDFIDNTLSALSITNVTLSPSFDDDVVTYTGTTSSASGTITATATDTDASVVIKMNGTAVTGTSLSFVSGAGNVLTVEVSGVIEGVPTTKTYTVTITRS